MYLPSRLALLFTAALLTLPAARADAPSAAPPVPAAPQQFAQLGDFQLESKAVIHQCAIGYRTLGTLNAERSNAVVFLTWHTGKSAEVLDFLGPKGIFDPAPYYVVIIDAIGNGVSCSPSNSDSQHGSAFPAFGIRDMVNSQHRLLTERLGLKHVRAVLGFSMGGMQAFQWAISQPDFMDVVIPLAGTPRLTSYDLLFWRAEELAIVSDPDYAGGKYRHNPRLPAYQLLLTMNLTTPAYRVANTPPAGFDKFFRESQALDPDAADANDSLWQIRAMLAHNVAADAGEPAMAQAAKRLRARLHVVGIAQDHMVNPAPALEFAKLAHAGSTVLQGDCGHFAVKCEADLLRPVVEAALGGRR